MCLHIPREENPFPRALSTQQRKDVVFLSVAEKRIEADKGTKTKGVERFGASIEVETFSSLSEPSVPAEIGPSLGRRVGDAKGFRYIESRGDEAVAAAAVVSLTLKELWRVARASICRVCSGKCARARGSSRQE